MSSVGPLCTGDNGTLVINEYMFSRADVRKILQAIMLYPVYPTTRIQNTSMTFGMFAIVYLCKKYKVY